MNRLSQNIKLTTLLKRKRKELGLRQTDIAKSMGDIEPSQYCRWEKTGTIPREEKQRKLLLSILEITDTELQGADYQEPKHGEMDTKNIIPLIQTICASGCREMTKSDLIFLINTQKELAGTISPQLVLELMKYR